MTNSKSRQPKKIERTFNIKEYVAFYLGGIEILVKAVEAQKFNDIMLEIKARLDRGIN